MIQLNLLPDVKLEYIRARRLKRTILVLSAVVSAASLALLIFMFLLVGVVQKKHLSNLDKDIATNKTKLQSIDNLDRILTVQNQLGALTALHDKKPVNSRLFSYVEQLTPVNVTISSLGIDMDAQTISITGNADSIGTINKFVDTLKFTMYQVGDDAKTQKVAFTGVVLQNFSVGTDKGSSYSVAFKFDPLLFDGLSATKLIVPKNKITTRSEVDKPADLFESNSSGSGQ